MFYNHLIIIKTYKFHDHIRVHTFHLDKPDSMFFQVSRRLTFGQSFRKLILSKCPNVWTITMIWRIFMTFREYVRIRKMYLDNQLSRRVEISWRYPFRSFRKIVLSKNYNNWFIYCDLTKFHHFIST